jgi:hypothetical protein
MTTDSEKMNINDRLNLIESMIAEGRRTTESFGWTFVLWGIAYYVAIGWASFGHSYIAWPATMLGAGILTGVIASRRAGNRPETTVGRSMMAIWIGMGVSAFLLMQALAMSGRLEPHLAIAFIGAMLGSANATSSIILKWKLQFACALVWWSAGISALFLTSNQAGIGFLAAIFFCQIVFGIYGMIAESRKAQPGAARQGAYHA